MRLTTKLFSTFFLNTIIVSLVFATSIIIARVLGPELFGVYRFVILIASTLTLLANLGFPEMIQLKLAQKLITLKDYLATSLCSTMAQYFIALMGLFYFVLYKGNLLGGDYHENDYLLYIPILLYCLIFQLNTIFHNAIFALDKIVRFQFFDIMRHSAFLLFTLAIYFFDILSIKNVFWVLVFTNSFSIIYVLYINFRQSSLSREKTKLVFSKELSRNSLKIYLNNVLTFMTYRLGMYILKFFTDFSQLGLYSLAITLVEKIWLLPESIRSVLYLELTNKRQGEHFVAQIMRIISVFVICGTILIASLSFYIIPFVFSAEYLGSVFPFLLLLPGVMMFCFSKILGSYFIVRDMIKINTYSSIIIAVINISLSIILIPNMKIVGAAIATSISYFVGSVYHIAIFKKTANLNFSDLFIIKRNDFKLLNLFNKNAI